MKLNKLLKCRDGRAARRMVNQYMAYCLKYNLLAELERNQYKLEKKMK